MHAEHHPGSRAGAIVAARLRSASVGLALSLAIAGPVAAQMQRPPPAKAPAQPVSPAPPTASAPGQPGAAPGQMVRPGAVPPAPGAPAQPAAAPPAAGKADQASPKSAWGARCSEAARPQERVCELTQSLFVAKTRQLLLGVSFRIAPPDRRPALKLTLPVGLYLPAGVTLAVDGGPATPLAIQTCTVKGCFVGMAVEDSLLQKLRKGSEMKVVFERLNRTPLALTVSLNGFAPSYEQIK